MKSSNRLKVFPSLLRILAATTCSLALAQSARAGASKEVVDHYVEACEQMAASASVQYQTGEWDIKDSPKLHPYCGCFGQKFADRAVTKTQLLRTPEEIKQSKAEELDMRNTCRSQLGLPPVPPKKIIKPGDIKQN